MGRPSEQIRSDDWTTSYVLDEAVLTYGEWLDGSVKRYAQHTRDLGDGKRTDPPSLEHVVEYERALLEGTVFQSIKPKRRIPTNRKPDDTPVEGKQVIRNGDASTG